MTDLTTDPQKYRNEIKRRLIKDYDSEWTPLWRLFEMSQLESFGYSLTLLVKENLPDRTLIFRQWIIDDLNQGVLLGIYNLNHIKITEEQFPIPLNQLFEIQEVLKLDINTQEIEGIILDGGDSELTDFKASRKLKWNWDNEMNESLSVLVKLIRKLRNRNDRL